MTRETRQAWTKRVRRWKRSGLGGRAFAEREGVNPRTLWWWRWRLARERFDAAQPPAFVEVIAPEAASAPVATESVRPLEVVVGKGVRVVVPVDFDEAHLRRVLRAVEAR